MYSQIEQRGVLLQICVIRTYNKAMLWEKGCLAALIVIIAGLLGIMTYTSASALQSANYRFDESAVGTNTILESSSTNFQANSATGDISIGNAASSNYQVEAGTQTTNDPVLSFGVVDASADFGAFSPTAATTATTSFSVSNYTSYGYIVQIEGDAPTNGSHVIDALPTADTSQPGIEQFGINLVANTAPTSVGANPDNGITGFGLAGPNYDTANEYRYANGDIIASAPKSSGKTVYTVSYLVNVGALTPGGQYTTRQTIIVTGTF
jgi:hypothetical protein